MKLKRHKARDGNDSFYLLFDARFQIYDKIDSESCFTFSLLVFFSERVSEANKMLVFAKKKQKEETKIDNSEAA